MVYRVFIKRWIRPRWGSINIRDSLKNLLQWYSLPHINNECQSCKECN
jgi:hypothetical protein